MEKLEIIKRMYKNISYPNNIYVNLNINLKIGIKC